MSMSRRHRGHEESPLPFSPRVKAEGSGKVKRSEALTVEAYESDCSMGSDSSSITVGTKVIVSTGVEGSQAIPQGMGETTVDPVLQQLMQRLQCLEADNLRLQRTVQKLEQAPGDVRKFFEKNFNGD